jgi:catalase
VLVADTADALAADLVLALGRHRVWDRAEPVARSAVPPAA